MRRWQARAIAYVWFFAMAFGLHASQASERERADFQQMMQQLANDPLRLRALVGDKFDALPNTHQNIVLGYFRRIVQMPEFSDKIFDLVYPIYQSNSKINLEDYMAEIGISLQMKGLRRLSPERQIVFLAFSLQMLEWLGEVSPEQCKQLVVNQNQKALEMQRMEFAFLADLPETQVRSIFELYYDALRAELIDIPMPRYVTSDQAQFAQEALEIAFVARAGQDNLERYGLVLENMERAPAEDVCEAVTVFMGSFMDIKPPLQDWALQSFVQSLQ